MENFSTKEISIIRYSKSLGLPFEDINEILIRGDSVYAASSDGLIVFNYKKIQSASPPIIVLDKIIINNTDVSLFDNLDLPSDSNNITLQFSGISFTGGEKVKFKYKLNGIQTNWLYNESGKIDFVGLPTGRFTLEIYAITDYTSVSQMFNLVLIIRPPFYKTWWFIGLIVTIFFLLSYYLVKIKLKLTKEKALVNSQMIDLKLQALRAQMNPHFIFNALTSIQYFFAKNDDITANKYMTKFASLIRETLNSSRKNYNSIADEVDMLDKYVGLEILRLDKITHYSIQISPEIEKENVQIPAMLLQPIVENAIIHGVRNTSEDEGRLQILFEIKDSLLVITIEDNGPGINLSNLTSQSKGLEITNQRIDTMNQVYSIGLSMKIAPRNSGISSGTIAQISIKNIL